MALKKRDINYVVKDQRGENTHLLVDLKREAIDSEPKLKEIADLFAGKDRYFGEEE